MNELQTYLKGIVNNLPETPGCYQYLDDSGTIIYVGKAKNLKRRVSSYFNKEQQTRKTQLLVKHIRDIRYVVVKTEEDALLLENNLIKRYKPHYNVLLKDDKTYPSIAITTEYLPRVFKTRQRGKRGAIYFGPYSHVPTLYALLDLCRELYQPRPCHTTMTREGVENGKYDVCLDYHIHRCKAPCVGKQSHDDYMRCIEACKEILKGNTAEVARRMRDEMTALADEWRFEEAQEIKRRYDLIENTEPKAKWFRLFCITLTCSTLKAKKRWLTLITYTLKMAALIKPLPLNIKRSWTKRMRSCLHWALWKCATAMQATPAK